MDINDIRNINSKNIQELENMIKDPDNIKEKLDIQQKIRRIIQNNDAIFFKLNIEEALQILRKVLPIPDDELLKVYKEMISPEKYRSITQPRPSNKDGFGR